MTDFGDRRRCVLPGDGAAAGEDAADLTKEGPAGAGAGPRHRPPDAARAGLRPPQRASLHRDPKPANMFLQALPDHADHVRLLDFGTAKFLEGAEGAGPERDADRASGRVRNAVAHGPRAGQSGACGRKDGYLRGRGAILFQLLAGTSPIRGATTPEQLMKAHVSEPVPSLAAAAARPSDRAELVQPMIERAMAKKPARRFPQARGDAGGAGDERRCVARRDDKGGRAPSPTRKRSPTRAERAPWWRGADTEILAIRGRGGSAESPRRPTLIRFLHSLPGERGARGPRPHRWRRPMQLPPAPTSRATPPVSDVAASSTVIRWSSSPQASRRADRPRRRRRQPPPTPPSHAPQTKPRETLRNARPRARNPWQKAVPARSSRSATGWNAGRA